MSGDGDLLWRRISTVSNRDREGSAVPFEVGDDPKGAAKYWPQTFSLDPFR